MVLSRRPVRWLGLLAFAAATVPFAIGAHLLSEIAALGREHAASVILSARHLYFVALGLGSIAVLGAIARFAGGSGSVRAAELLASLPFGGRGLRFAGLTFAVQIAFYAATQYAEGCPVWGGDIVAGLLTALFAAAIASLLLALLERRIVSLILSIGWLSAKPCRLAVFRAPRAPRARFTGRRGALLSSIANRPPPAMAVR